MAEAIKLRFSKKQTQALICLSNRKHTEVFYGGAAGGGKTVLGCAFMLMRRIKYPGTRGAIGRKTLKTLKRTTLKTLFWLWDNYFCYNDQAVKINYNKQDNILYFSNGSEIYLEGLKVTPGDPEQTEQGGIEVTDYFIDEVTGVAKEAYETANSRIRYKLINGTPKMYCAGNPAHNWVKFKFIMDEYDRPIKVEPDIKVIIAHVEDNPNKEFVEAYKKQLLKLPSEIRRRLLYGDWTFNPAGELFLYDFKHENIVEELPINNFERSLFAFDFNYDPTTALLMQLIIDKEENGGGLNFVKEFKKTGGTKKLCDLINHKVNMGALNVWITGDQNGTHKSSTAGSQTDYQIIKEELLIPGSRLIDVTTANLRHQESQDLCNYVFTNIPVRISAKGCPGFINDVRTAQAKNGKIVKNRDLGQGLDLLDCGRYGINAFFLNGSKDVRKYANIINPEYYKRYL